MTAQLNDEEQGGRLGARTFADYVLESDILPIELAVGFAGLARAVLFLIEANTDASSLELLQRIGRAAAAFHTWPVVPAPPRGRGQQGATS